MSNKNLKEIDFDNIAQTVMTEQASHAMISILQKKISKKELSHLTLKALDHLYRAVDADDEDHFVFTSSQAEAINHILFATFIDVIQKTGKNHFITSTIDEAPQIMGMSRMQEMGALFDMVPVNQEGIVTVENLIQTITPRTVLLSLSYANALTGVLQPIEELGKLCRERGILFHVDVSHVIGKKKISFKKSSIDFLTFNGELTHGPTSGALFIKKEHQISPFIVGGTEQAGLRGGNYPIPSFFALAKACELMQEDADFVTIELARLRDLFEKTLLQQIPEAKILFRSSLRVPHITLVEFPKVSSDALLYFLNKKKVFASMGGGSFQKMVHVLKASQISSPSCVSFSFTKFTTEQEIFEGCKLISETYHHLKKVSEKL